MPLKVCIRFCRKFVKVSISFVFHALKPSCEIKSLFITLLSLHPLERATYLIENRVESVVFGCSAGVFCSVAGGAEVEAGVLGSLAGVAVEHCRGRRWRCVRLT